MVLGVRRKRARKQAGGGGGRGLKAAKAHATIIYAMANPLNQITLQHNAAKRLSLANHKLFLSQRHSKVYISP